MNIASARRRLQNCVIGHTIAYHATIPSTMPLAHQLAADPATRSGAIVIAEEQTLGRGRRQRRWEAPFGQALLMSVILKPPHLPAIPTQLPILAGVAVAHTLRAFDPALKEHVWLKWPNDALLGAEINSAGKVAGVLIETSYTQAKMEHAVLGIGVNVNQTRPTLPLAQMGAPPPVSLRLFLGRPLDRAALLVALCQQLGAIVSSPLLARDIYNQWRPLLVGLGQRVTIHTEIGANCPLTGVAIDVTENGELIVASDDGARHAFSAGDVSLRFATPPEIGD